MTDIHTAEQRARNMRAIKSEGTKLEQRIEANLVELGYEYEMHRHDLPGTPDFFIKYFDVVIQAHGCFWHGHGCHLCKPIEKNADWWYKKLNAQKARDQRKLSQLSDIYRVLTVWECATKGTKKLEPEELMQQIDDWIRHSALSSEISYKAI